MSTFLRWLVWMLVAAATGVLLAFLLAWSVVAWLFLSYLG